MISIVIPTLNEAERLPCLLAYLRTGGAAAEIIVAMLLNVVGLKAHGRLSWLVSRRANRFIQKWARQHSMAGA